MRRRCRSLWPMNRMRPQPSSRSSAHQRPMRAGPYWYEASRSSLPSVTAPSERIESQSAASNSGQAKISADRAEATGRPPRKTSSAPSESRPG